MTAPRRPPGRYDERRALPARRLLLLGGGPVGLVALVAAYLLFARYTGRTATAAVLRLHETVKRAVQALLDAGRGR